MPNFTEVFEDVTKLGKKVPTNLYLESGLYPVIDQGQSYIAGYINDSDGIFSDVPAIIFGDHTRAIKYVNQPFFLGADGVKVLKAKVDNVDYKYLYYSLCCAKIPDTGYNRHFKWLKEVEIPLPPLAIQKEIAYNLDKVSEAIDLCRKILDKLDFLVKAKFAEMFGEITEIVPLANIASYFNGLTYKPENVKVNGTIVLRSSNIQNNELDFQDLVRVDCQVKDKLFVKPNDILMCSRNGSAKLVGKVALIKECPEQMTFGAFMMIIRSEYYPYLFTYFQSNDFRRQIVTGATTTINQITSNMLNKVLIPLPSKEKVSEFAAFLNKTDLAKSAVKKTLDKAETLKNALMQKYFG